MPEAPWKIRSALLPLSALGLVLVLFWGDYNVINLWKLHREKKELSGKIEELRIRNQALADQILNLKENPEAIEKVARENLGMAADGETIYRLVTPNRTDSLTDTLDSKESP